MAWRLVAVIVIAFVVAGCSQRPGTDEDEQPPQDLSVATNDLAYIGGLNSVVDLNAHGGEPMLGVAGERLFTYAEMDSGVERVYRSTDGGRSWTPTSLPTVPAVQSTDADMVVDRDGTIWFDTLSNGCTYVAVSRDEGASWTSHPAACLGPDRDRPRVVPIEGGTAYLYHTSVRQHAALKTTDYGITWVPTGPVGEVATAEEGHMWGGGGFWNRATDSVFFTFSVAVGPPLVAMGDIYYAPGFAVTRDGGASFTVHTIPDVQWRGDDMIGSGLVDGAADEAGNVYLTWSDLDGGDGRTWMTASSDDGRTWATPTRVDADARTDMFPTVAAAGPGRVAIAFYEADESGAPESLSAGTGWNVTLAWTQDALADPVAFSRGHLSASSHHVGPICPNGVACGLASGPRALLDFFDIQALPDGRVGGVWASSTQAQNEAYVSVNVFGVTAEPVLAG